MTTHFSEFETYAYTISQEEKSKMTDGFTEKDMGTWNDVTFTEAEKERIQNFAKENPLMDSVDIRKILFPNISEKGKGNAEYKIRHIIWYWYGA